MENTWRLKKITEKARYTQDNLTIDEVLEEMYNMLGYAKHGCLESLSRLRAGNLDGTKLNITDTGYTFVYDFYGEEVKYIFEREG